MFIKFKQVVYPAINMEESVKFYTDILDFVQIPEKEGSAGHPRTAFLQAPDGSMVKLVERLEGCEDNIENFHICWDVDNIQLLIDDLSKKGVCIYKGPPMFGNIMTGPPFELKKGKCGCPGVYILDPAGNSIEFHQLTSSSLQTKTAEEVKALIPLIISNEYIPEAKGQDTIGKAGKG